jgi:riboflavin synthase
MFTGIISHLGKVKEKDGSLFTFRVSNEFARKLENGTSVSINGACLTVTAVEGQTFSVDVMPESEKRTMLTFLKRNDLVNLELPATPETVLSGHIVQGHVDGTGEVLAIEEEGISKLLTISVPEELRKYIVEKGSIAINGISLTVISIDDKQFTVGIIPFTWENTMMHTVNSGDVVNIETDVFAKYIEKMLGKGKND